MQRSTNNYRTYHFISGSTISKLLYACIKVFCFYPEKTKGTVSDYPRCFMEGAEEALSQHVLLTRAQFRTGKAIVCKYSVIND